MIFLCMRGAPSHVDTFDYKPKLNAASGKPGLRPGTQLLGSRWKFSRHGRSVPRDTVWLANMTVLAEACALLGDRPHAAELYSLLLPHHDVIAMWLSLNELARRSCASTR